MIDAVARKYDPIAVSAESTVVAEYIPDAASQAAYQSESALEQELIRLLESQAYEYLPVTSEEQLVANLRSQLEGSTASRSPIRSGSGSSPQASQARMTASLKKQSVFKKTTFRSSSVTMVQRRTSRS